MNALQNIISSSGILLFILNKILVPGKLNADGREAVISESMVLLAVVYLIIYGNPLGVEHPVISLITSPLYSIALLVLLQLANIIRTEIQSIDFIYFIEVNLQILFPTLEQMSVELETKNLNLFLFDI
jgi:hypothetical protein